MREDLVERLEDAAEPSREIDVAIFRLIGLTEVQERHCRQWCKMEGRTDLTRDRYIDAWAPPFTSSLDAALTLVPDGMGWSVSGRKPYGASVERPLDLPALSSRCPNEAIALCIAALKARAERPKDHSTTDENR